MKTNTHQRPIVLIHGLWMTPLSWEHWVDRYTSEGCTVIDRAWPGMDGSVEELRRDPSGFARTGITEVVDHYQTIIQGLDTAPVVIGHSFGGLIAQILLDRGTRGGRCFHRARARQGHLLSVFLHS